MDVKHLCLGVLTTGDATGYDIKKYFEQSFSHFFIAGYGSIYPALAELNREGLVTCTEMAQAKLPDKKVYCITEEGEVAFRDALIKTPPRHKVRSQFLVLMYFAHLLPRERLVAVIQERLDELDETLALMNQLDNRRGPQQPGMDFALAYGDAMYQAMRDHIAEAGQRLIADLDRRAPEAARNAA